MDNLSTLEVCEKAKIEVREDESRKQQSLEQFREWIGKHPFIKNCRTDDGYLLPFLRSKKYNMNRVFDSFEKALIFAKEHEDWFDWKGEKLQKVFDLLDTGFLKVLKNRDRDGRRVILCNNEMDLDKFTADDVFRLNCVVVLALANEEITQLCGVTYIDDFTSATMKYITMFPLKSIYDFTVQLRATPIRLKNIILVGLPSFATQFVNIVKLGLSEVMNKRLQTLNDNTELWNFVDKSLVTKDYGGDADEKEAIEDFRKVIDENIDFVRNFFDYEIDMVKAEILKDTHENVGSFRKLEID
ncbi:hypothetical protein PVAND_000099 [Polypedilum vanderplanki]|uniref:CRAL-TRIO domain-containing protein n=1 Tax=Polypedilum vanderplanki TaxID=319348 RepID=A0A9J6BKA0_POLVA|nr:hypothetical protein PVAND_000099 [Polypedilum vanderplanki]